MHRRRHCHLVLFLWVGGSGTFGPLSKRYVLVDGRRVSRAFDATTTSNSAANPQEAVPPREPKEIVGGLVVAAVVGPWLVPLLLVDSHEVNHVSFL